MQITSTNKKYFKNFIKDFYRKNTDFVPISYRKLKGAFSSYDTSLDSDPYFEVKIIPFKSGDFINLTTRAYGGEYLYLPGLENDVVGLEYGDDSIILGFDQLGRLYYNQNLISLGTQINLGTKRFTVKGLGGALLSVEDIQPPSYSIGVSTTTVTEGDSVNFTINTENVNPGTTLYYTTAGTISAGDFSNNSLTGSFNIVGVGSTIGIATVTRTIVNDLLSEGEETFNLEIRSGSTTGTLVASSPTISVLNVVPSYTIGVSTTNLSEGDSVTFNIETQGIPSGTVLYYTLSGNISSNDFSDNLLSGSFTAIGIGTANPTGVVTKTLAIDISTEGEESFQFQVRTGSTSGPIVATSSTVTINDTTPTFTITPSTLQINEAQSVTFTVDTTHVPNGTTLYYTTTGSVSASDFSNNSLSGSFSIVNFGGDNGTGVFTRTTRFDYVSGLDKNFQIQLRLNSTSGTIVGTSSTVVIKSIDPTYSITPSVNTINEGQSVNFSVSANIPNGSILYYTTLGNVSSSDFSNNSLSGSAYINNGTLTITRTAVRDRITKGDRDFAIQIRIGSTAGTVVATSTYVKIVDTSKTVGENANGKTFGPVQVNRDNGNPSLASDWYTICGIDDLPAGSSIALFIDTSGSMTQSTIQASYELLLSKLEEKNITIISVANPNEDWITPFLTDLS